MAHVGKPEYIYVMIQDCGPRTCRTLLELVNDGPVGTSLEILVSDPRARGYIISMYAYPTNTPDISVYVENINDRLDYSFDNESFTEFYHRTDFIDDVINLYEKTKAAVTARTTNPAAEADQKPFIRIKTDEYSVESDDRNAIVACADSKITLTGDAKVTVYGVTIKINGGTFVLSDDTVNITSSI